MKKTVSLILALLMITGALFLTACGGKEGGDAADGKESESKKLADIPLKDVTEAVCNALTFDGLVSEFLYKEDDTDDMVNWTYDAIEASCHEKLKDYVITLPSDFNQSFAVFVFDESVTDEEIAEMRDVVTDGYIKSRATSLQMYMPEQYDIVSWQLEHPEAVWRQYDNALVLLMYDKSEATAGWDAIDALLK